MSGPFGRANLGGPPIACGNPAEIRARCSLSPVCALGSSGSNECECLLGAQSKDIGNGSTHDSGPRSWVYAGDTNFKELTMGILGIGQLAKRGGVGIDT